MLHSALVFLQALVLTQAPTADAANTGGAGRAESVEIAEVDLEVATPDPAVRLAGTLTLPEGPGPHPAIVLVTGSGGHTRDQVISGSPMFRMLAEGLTARGLVVLRVDDRGVGSSSGPDVMQSTSRDRAGDSLACVRFLLELPDVDPGRVGIFGHSEGAFIAPLIANEEPRVAFLALLSPPALPCGDVWIRQRIADARGSGVSEELLAALEAPRRALVDYLGRESFDEARFQLLARKFVAAHGIPEEQVTSEQIEGALGDLRAPWFRFFLDHDPAVALRTTRIPVFAAFGALDEQVAPAENLPVLVQALLDAGNTDFAVRLYPDQDHFFLRAPGLEPGVHSFGKMQLAAEFVDELADWILAHE